MSSRDHIKLDMPIIYFSLAILLFGMMSLYSASMTKNTIFNPTFVYRQLIWIAAGLAIAYMILRIDYRKFAGWSYFIYGSSLALLVLVLVLGHVSLGAQRWIRIWDVTIQPSEFAKIAFIIAMANYLTNNDRKLRQASGLIMPMILTCVPFVLILVEPDLGTSLILIPVFFLMIYAAGGRVKHLLFLLVIGIALGPVFWHFLRDYQRQRLLVFLNPNIDPLGAGYTVIQSKIAIGSGYLFGKGWLGGTQNQLNFLPERHTDFIFSVIGEEWGFFGSSIIILLYVLLILRALNITERTNDKFGKLLGTGIITALSFQVFINISMTMGFMPVVGLPLPLVSYGGSSLITTLVMLAFLLNIKKHSSIF